jgi:palmitoyl transferase
MQRTFSAFWMVLFLFVAPLHAEPNVYGEQRISGWWNALTDDISQTWEQPQRYDLYLPFLSWHARFMYDKKNRQIQRNAVGRRAGRFPL